MSIFKAIGVTATVGIAAAASFYMGYRYREYKYEKAHAGPEKAKQTIFDEVRKEYEDLNAKFKDVSDDVKKTYQAEIDRLKTALDDMEKSNTAEQVRKDIKAAVEAITPKGK